VAGTPAWKMLENPRRGFSLKNLKSLKITKKINILSGENPRRGFSSIFRFAVPTTRSR
jgi:hypothetical protein